MARAAGTHDVGSPSTSIDEHIGSRIRLRRTLLGLTQEKVADALGLTFQQVQRFERGMNRMGASRLFDLARVLDVPIGFFFDDAPAHLGGSAGVELHLARLTDGPSAAADDPVSTKERMEILRAYCRISDPDVRKRMLELMKSLAD